MTAIDAIKAANVSALDAARALGLVIERNGRGKCPWHGGGNEKRGALSFKNGRCHCFACGAGGDAIELTGKLLDLEAKEAAEALCGALGIAFDGRTDGDWKEKRREAEREKQKSEAERRERVDAYGHLCEDARAAGKTLDGWTPEGMEENPDAFWALVKRKAMAEERLEVLEMEIRSL